ncbi:MAG TPA: M13 family metallopeptidase [Candidatus Paceibacterota bacterium]|nr:M13 family metallopeptidase [Candidatus Paceibacterota bacterium]
MNEEKKAIVPKELNKAVRPVDDFFAYVNSKWLEGAKIPSSESRWGSFDILREENITRLHEILEEIAKNENLEKGSERRKLRDFYRTGMDEEKIERDGLAPVQEFLDELRQVSREGLPRILARLHRFGVNAGFLVSVEQDEKESKTMALHLYQGGLGLPDREYYLKDAEESETIREKYRTHLERMFVLLGEKPESAEKSAQAVFELEKKFALASKERVALREIEKNYFKMTLKELGEIVPEFDCKEYFDEAGIEGTSSVIVGQPDFLTQFSKSLSLVPLQDWRSYFQMRFLESVSGKLPSAFVKEQFDFYRLLSGAEEIRPRWKRVIAEIDASLGEALGKEYVKKYFSENSKNRVKEMMGFLCEAYRDRIENLEWMTEETKSRALQKLQAIIPKIGYPDVWRDYGKLVIQNDSYVLNHLRARAFEWDREVQKIGKPVDHTEWLMSPQTVNAYFHPTMQEIAFPAGILQPPFFYADADDAVNYGAVGAVIGHELTHGFDDQGRKFDENGNLNDWWSPEDAERFKQHADVLAGQFDAYEPLPGFFVNGHLTLGENIADLGGLVIAFSAFKKSLEGKERPKKIDGFTPEARFFLAWAKVWRAKCRDEFVKMLLVVDPHSPEKYRVWGPVSNMTEFYETFGMKEGDGLYRKPEDRVKIW